MRLFSACISLLATAWLLVMASNVYVKAGGDKELVATSYLYSYFSNFL
jgi:hypothetical protein